MLPPELWVRGEGKLACAALDSCLETCGRKSECGLFQGFPRGSWKNASRLLESPTRSLSSPTSLATSSHSLYQPFPWSWVARPGSTALPFLFLAG